MAQLRKGKWDIPCILKGMKHRQLDEPSCTTEANVAEGMRLYNIQCQHCHGKKGKNDGGVIKSGQYPPPPWDGYQSNTLKLTRR